MHRDVRVDRHKQKENGILVSSRLFSSFLFSSLLFLSCFFFSWTFPAIYFAVYMRKRVHECEGCEYTRNTSSAIARAQWGRHTYPFPRFYSRRLWSWIEDPKGAYVIPLAIVRTPTSFLFPRTPVFFSLLSTGTKREEDADPRAAYARHRAHVHSYMLPLSFVRIELTPPLLPLRFHPDFRFVDLRVSSAGDARDWIELQFSENEFNTKRSPFTFLVNENSQERK